MFIYKNRRRIVCLTLLSFFSVQISTAHAKDKLIMDIGYYSDDVKKRLESVTPRLQEAFAKNGLSVSVTTTQAGTTTPSTPIKWDFAISNFVIVTMQRFNNIPITPIFWSKNCSFEAVAYSLDSNASMQNMHNKKILVFGYGYPTLSVLKAINDWKLSKAQLYITDKPNIAGRALADKKVDLLISDTVWDVDEKKHIPTVFGPVVDSARYKQLSITDYKYPCRALSVANKVSEKNVELIKKTVADDSHPALKRFDLINAAEAEKLVATLKDPKLKEISAKLIKYKEK